MCHRALGHNLSYLELQVKFNCDCYQLFSENCFLISKPLWVFLDGEVNKPSQE